LIRSIAELGRASRELGEFGNDLEVLVDRSGAKHALVLNLRISENRAKYEGLELEENRGEEKYLYRRDPSGKPGLFITGRIPRGGDIGIEKLRRSLDVLASRQVSPDARNSAKRLIDDFEKRKVVGITRGRGVEQAKGGTVVLVRDLIRSVSRRVMKDICQTIRTIEPEDLLLTVKIIEGSEERHLGDIPEFVEIFKASVTGVRTGRTDASVSQASGVKCAICNSEAVSDEFEQNPFPFFFLDKPSFIPSGDHEEAFKVFPLCSNCFLDLRRGQKFLEKYLDFSISTIEGRRAEVRFWLIPVLNNPESVMSYIRDLGKSATKVERKESRRFLYLTNLRDMCNTMGSITTLALESGFEAAEAYLTFTALFYTKDRQGHMRLISRSEGIYPKRLRFVAEVKRKVDSLYPFEKVGVRFGFPLLREFLVAPNSEGWHKDLATILGDIFTGESLHKPLLYKAVANKIQEGAREADLKTIADTSFKGLSLIEYVGYLEPSGIEEVRLVSSQEVREAEKSRSIWRVKSFLDAHSRLLRDGTLRAVCATGIATGILLEVQRETRKSMPFWGRLNRLEMDLERVKQLFPQIINKLHEYDFHAYDDVLAYLGGQEVSNLDLGQRDLSKDLISLVFAIGMSQGYLIVHEKEE